MKHITVVITVIVIFGKLIGFCREIVLAYFYGTSQIVDAYAMAESIPALIMGVLISVSVAFVPSYMRLITTEGNTAGRGFLNNTITILGIIGIIVSMLIILCRYEIIEIIVPGLDVTTKKILSQFLMISVWHLVLLSLAQVYVSYVNCNNEFVGVQVAQVLIPVVQIAVIILSANTDSYFLPWSYVISYALYLLILYYLAVKTNYSYKFVLKASPEILESLRMLVPIFLSSLIAHINTTIDRYFAASLASGTIAAMSYSSRMVESLYVIGSTAVLTVAYPLISRYVTEKNKTKLVGILKDSHEKFVFITLPCMVLMLGLSDEIIAVVFQHGRFDASATVLTAGIMACYVIQVLPRGINDLLAKVLYAEGKKKWIIMISMGVAVINTACDYIFVSMWGAYGLALATSISLLFMLPFYICTVSRTIDSPEFKKVFSNLWRMLGGGLGMLINIYLLKNIFVNMFSPLIVLLIVSVSAVLIYAIVLLFLKEKYILTYADKVRKCWCHK